MFLNILRISVSKVLRPSKKIVVSRPDTSPIGGGRFFLFAIFTIFHLIQCIGR